jgi:hypothetical protein
MRSTILPSDVSTLILGCQDHPETARTAFPASQSGWEEREDHYPKTDVVVPVVRVVPVAVSTASVHFIVVPRAAAQSP